MLRERSIGGLKTQVIQYNLQSVLLKTFDAEVKRKKISNLGYQVIERVISLVRDDFVI